VIPVERLRNSGDGRTVEVEIREKKTEARVERERAAGLGAMPAPAPGLGSLFLGSIAGMFGIRRPR